MAIAKTPPKPFTGSGKARHKAAKAALLAASDNLPALPKAFEADAQYRVRLARAVVHDAITLRPSQDVILKGDYAETIRDAILGAARVP